MHCVYALLQKKVVRRYKLNALRFVKVLRTERYDHNVKARHFGGLFCAEIVNDVERSVADSATIVG